jgi:ParB family chromosome partitioning protein
MSNGPQKPSRRPALGRGLSSLIQSPGGAPATTGAPAGRRILEVPIEQVAPRADQPRRHFKDTALDELAASIRERGVLSPILVRKSGPGYAIIAGERRWRAAQRAGLKEVPVVLEEADDVEAFEIALIENIQREDLNPIEEAEAYERLMGLHGWTQEQCAEKVGKDRSSVANALRLLKLPDSARDAVVEGRLAMGHARAVVALGDHGVIETATREILAKGLSVRQTEALVRRLKRGDGGGRGRETPKEVSPGVRDLVARLQQVLGTRVSLKDRGNRGSLVIDYASLDDLDRVVDRILGDR